MQRRVRTPRSSARTLASPDSLPHDPARPAARSDCSEHGPRVVRLPWAEASSRFTALFEALASWLKEATQGIAELLALSGTRLASWNAPCNVGSNVARQSRFPTRREDKRHRYLTVVNDLNRSRVLFRRGTPPGQPGRLLEDVERRVARVEAVAMDMWDPYVASQHLDESEKKIASSLYDKYHIAAHLAKAVDQVRRAENRLLALGDERLTGTKYALRHPANFSEDAWREFRRCAKAT